MGLMDLLRPRPVLSLFGGAAAPAPLGRAPERTRSQWGGRSLATQGRLGPGVTPAVVVAALRAAEAGDPRRQAVLLEQMQERFIHVGSVLGVRRRALLSVPWRVAPSSDRRSERRWAETCQQWLTALRPRQLFWDLTDAIPTGYAAVELEWAALGGQAVPVRAVPVLGRELVPHPQEVGRWLVEDTAGRLVELEKGRLLVHTCQARSGWAPAAGLGRSLLWVWLFASHALKDWAAYAEMFGSPLRVGRYPEGASDEEVDALEVALQKLGVDAYAVLPEGFQVDFHAEAGARSGGDTYERLLTWCERAASKAVLGQTLTTEEGSSGSRALGDVHNEVRRDILDSDARQLEESLSQLLRWATDFNLGVDAPAPRLELMTTPERDERAVVERQEIRARVLGEALKLGVPVTEAQIREELELRPPESGEPVVTAPVLASARPVTAAARAPHIEQLDALLRSGRAAAGPEWRAVVKALAAEMGADRAEVAKALRGAQLDGVMARLADTLIRAEALGQAQAARGGSTVQTPDWGAEDAWRELARATEEQWREMRAAAERRALASARLAALRAAESLTGDPEVQPEDVQAPLDRAVEASGATAWGRGQADQLEREAGRRPYFRYHTMQDAAVRDSHRAMEGRVWPADHPIWQTWRPPNGWGCRCWVTAHTEEEVAAAGWKVEATLPRNPVDNRPLTPDAGWARDHLREEPEYDWSAFPADWLDAVGVVP